MYDILKAKQMAEAIKLGDRIDQDIVADPAGPTAYLLMKARAEALNALEALAECAPQDVALLQSIIRRYRDMCDWLTEARAEADEAHAQLSAEERDELLRVTGMENDL
jgi:hypothetical protein